ncbi:MAG: hypothetical protein QE280_01165 [Caulobacter sp.]|nr:hypothetical protein [Caulobacter sp.]
MRYRPFGARYATAVSVVSLQLHDRAWMSARDWRQLLELSMAEGINSFEIAGTGAALLDGLAQALAAVERRLVFLSWQAPGQDDLEKATSKTLERLGLDHLDMLVLPNAAYVPEALVLKQQRAVRQLAVAAMDSDADVAIATAGIDALITPFNLASSAAVRHRLKQASSRDMAVIGSHVCPDGLEAVSVGGRLKRGLLNWSQPRAPVRNQYQFLKDVPDWTSEEICLAYALFEPSITSIRIEADSGERIRRLAVVPDRDLPTGIAAQIEMARFSADRT